MALTDRFDSEWYRQALEIAPVGMCFADQSFKFIEVNKAFCEMLGYTRGELLTKTILDVTHPDDRARTTEKLNGLYLGKLGAFKVEKRYLTKSGDVVWGFATVSVAEKDALGKAVRTFGVVQDITARKRLEEKLKESETNYHTMIEMSPDAVAVHSGGRIVYINEAGLKALGAKGPEDVIGKPTLSFVHPDSLEVVKERIAKMAKTGEMAPLVEEKFVRLDGSPIDVEVVAKPIVYRGESAVLVVIHDISESKRDKDELRKSESKYRTLAEAAHDMIFVVDRAGTVTYVNSFAAAQFGVKPEAMIGHKRADFFGPAAASQDITLQKVFEKGEPIYRETRTPFKDNTLWLGTWLVPLKKNGEVTGILGVSRDITVQKEAELELMILNRSLKESEESYRGLFNSVGEAIYIQDAEAKFLDVNPGAEKMYGYPREWFIGKTPLEVSAPGKNDMEKIKGAVGRAFAGEPQEFEFWGVRSNGEVFPKDVRLYKGRYFGKDVVIALAVDITERKRTEDGFRLLRETTKVVSEATDFAQALEAMMRTVCTSVGWIYGEAWVMGSKQGVLELSLFWYHSADKKMEGFRRGSEGYTFKLGEGLPGRVWASKKAEWIPDVSVNGSVFLRAEEALAAGIKASLGVPIIIDDQVLAVIVFFATEVQREEKGMVEIVSSLGIQLGLLFQRKKAEEQLKREKEFTDNLINGLPGIYYLFDREGKFRRWNENLVRIGEYSVEEMLVRVPTDFFPEEERRMIADKIGQVFEKGYAETEGNLLTKSGKRLPYYFNGTRVEIDGETMVSGMGVNISARIEAEKMREEFLMIAAHELRSPVTALKWQISMLADGTYGPASEKMIDCLSGMSLTAERLIKLVNDMISASRIENRSLKFKIGDFSAEKIIGDVAAVYGPEALKKGLKLDLKGVDRIKIHADADKMAQVLSNLIDNAVKFTPSRGTITLAAKAEGNKARIAVADTGVGISRELQSKLFGKFVQAPLAEGALRGTGLGLFISRELARNMGGELVLERSEVGKGSTFVLSLPIKK